jgi:hypothetical protein
MKCIVVDLYVVLPSGNKLVVAKQHSAIIARDIYIVLHCASTYRYGSRGSATIAFCQTTLTTTAVCTACATEYVRTLSGYRLDSTGSFWMRHFFFGSVLLVAADTCTLDEVGASIRAFHNHTGTRSLHFRCRQGGIAAGMASLMTLREHRGERLA